MNKKNYYVYILSSHRNGTLYVGVTSNLYERVLRHKIGIEDSFTKKYRVTNLVYYEIYEDIHQAIHREKQLKKWNRNRKLNLIESKNPLWKDVFHQTA